jgi:diguanylate cyclase (GGDEF)-like protein/PAS domain S-box-containing protein
VSVLKASQAVSDDIVLESLVRTLLRIAMEHVGADRGLLLLPDGAEWRVAAEAVLEDGALRIGTRTGAPRLEDAAASVLAYALRTRERVLVDAQAPHPFAADPHFAVRAPRSLLCLPLLKQGAPAGVLYLENRLVAGALGERTAVLELLAAQAAISLENATLVANLQREQGAIRELNAGLERRVAERTADLDHALREQEAILENALTGIAFVRERVILRCNTAFERLFGFPENSLTGRSTRVLYAGDADFDRIEREFYPAIRRNAGVFEDQQMYRQDGTWFWATSHAKLVDPADPGRGLVWVLQDITARKQAEQALAEQSAAFERLARIDGLTGLANRRHFDACARAAFAECRERGEPLAAALIDLDHFKRINDTCSHAAGDAVLARTGALIRAHLPAPAIAGRYGGEEFAVVFPGLDADEARAHCEALRAALAAHDFADAHPGLRVTLSGGLADASGHDTLERLLHAADTALYRAKHEGRDRIAA